MERLLTISPSGPATAVELLTGCERGTAETRAKQATSQSSRVVRAAIVTEDFVKSELRGGLGQKMEGAGRWGFKYSGARGDKSVRG
jgi:hypothetical protein